MVLRYYDFSVVCDCNDKIFFPFEQSSRNVTNLGSWDPQDSFDLIESVTNGSISIAGNMGEISPLLQISPDAGAHLTAPPLGPVSPNCELSAVLDQAFHYPDT